MAWWRALREVFRYEWLLLQRHRKLAIAGVGLLFVPALYALIYLWSMWDPASHTRALPAGLVNLDTGARYRDRDLNLGADVLAAIAAGALVVGTVAGRWRVMPLADWRPPLDIE